MEFSRRFGNVSFPKMARTQFHSELLRDKLIAKSNDEIVVLLSIAIDFWEYQLAC